MRTLFVQQPPLDAYVHDHLNMAAVANANNDHLPTSPDDADVHHHHPDLSILVNSLSASPAPNQDSNPASEHRSEDLSRPPSTNPPASSAAAEPPTPLPPSVQQQAQMAIQSILATAQQKGSGQDSVWSMNNVTLPSNVDTARQNGQPSTSKRRLEDADEEDPHAKIRRTVQEHVQHDNERLLNMTTVVCLHAAVAQKSYGSEKRFLCPPPLVRIEGPFGYIRDQKLAMSIVSEHGEKGPETVLPLEPSATPSFKFLHVTGAAKAKSFNLALEIIPPPAPGMIYEDGARPRPWAVFESAPVTIISKPSKKTAKTRNISSCILAGGPVSLFNRINSQTVRTKYMTIDNAHLCASNVSWSAFNVNVIRRPQDLGPVAGPQPVTYGSEIVLSDSMTGIATAPLIIRKVDKGKISPEEGGPVSQMQKIALQRVNPDGTRHYLSAAGPVPGTPGVVAPPAPGNSGSHHLLFQSPRTREEVKDGIHTIHDEVDDYLCWTIVGISKFQYTFFDALGQNNKIPEMPITPFPTLFQPPIYRPQNNVLDLTVSSFFYENPKTGHHSQLEIWLGDIGPLTHRLNNAPTSGPLTSIAPFYGSTDQQPPPPGTPMAGVAPPAPGAPVPAPPPPPPPTVPAPTSYISSGALHTNVTVDMPPIQQIVKALQDEARRSYGVTSDSVEGAENEVNGNSPPDGPVNIAGKSLPLLFIRGADGIGYHSGRSVTCENVFLEMNNPVNPQGPPGEPAWLSAAQSAAADSSMHGWTLRVL
ncbi:hypothetical protein ACEPAF_3691 [Sanghuangporus sanghuang]